MDRIYFDHAATTATDNEILQEMLPYLTGTFGNADSLHSFGRAAANAVTSARDRIAQILGVTPSEIYFTSGGTESDNWAVSGMLHPQKSGIALSSIEHQATLSAGEREKTRGREVVSIPCNGEGIVTPEAVRKSITPQTGLVCVMAVNNETGCIQPIEEIAKICKERGVLLFCDCVQGASCLNLQEICAVCDGISLSSHKIYGAKGTGVLYLKRGVKLSPLIVGGEQERGLRGGTLNVAGVVGMARALERAQKNRERFCNHTQALRDLFERELCSVIEGITIDGKNRNSSISHLTFAKGGESFLSLLDLKGLACSGGAACSAHASYPSHVMLAMGKSESEAKRGVRFSFGKDNTEEEVRCAVEIVKACYQK